MIEALSNSELGVLLHVSCGRSISGKDISVLLAHRTNRLIVG